MASVCVDANVVLAILTPEDFSAAATSLWDEWYSSGTEVVAPALLIPEVTSTLRKAVHFGRLEVVLGDRVFEAFCQMEIRLVVGEELTRIAWELARRFNRPVAYDAFYVATAQLEGCELWTADRRLVNSFPLPGVRWIGELATDG